MAFENRHGYYFNVLRRNCQWIILAVLCAPECVRQIEKFLPVTAAVRIRYWLPELPCTIGKSLVSAGLPMTKAEAGLSFFPAVPCGAVSARTIPSAAAALALP